ncbi:hypothetical protein [Bradyrhizobium diazoefficiens]
MRSAALVLACLLAASGAEAAEQHVYMSTQGPSCVDQSRRYEGAWSCRGPAGYAADFSDEGNMAAVALRPPGRLEKVIAYVFRGSGRVFGDIVDWRIVDGTPTAAVLRIWRAEPQADGAQVQIQELAVFKVTLAESCRVASIDARQPAANEAARRLAGEILSMPCSEPRSRDLDARGSLIGPRRAGSVTRMAPR